MLVIPGVVEQMLIIVACLFLILLHIFKNLVCWLKLYIPMSSILNTSHE